MRTLKIYTIEEMPNYKAVSVNNFKLNELKSEKITQECRYVEYRALECVEGQFDVVAPSKVRYVKVVDMETGAVLKEYVAPAHKIFVERYLNSTDKDRSKITMVIKHSSDSESRFDIIKSYCSCMNMNKDINFNTSQLENGQSLFIISNVDEEDDYKDILKKVRITLTDAVLFYRKQDTCIGYTNLSTQSYQVESINKLDLIYSKFSGKIDKGVLDKLIEVIL